jgi:hypothetical protein
MVVAAGLLVAGAVINGVGIRNPSPTGRRMGPGGEQPPPKDGAGGPSIPVRGSREQQARREGVAEGTGPAFDPPPG